MEEEAAETGGMLGLRGDRRGVSRSGGVGGKIESTELKERQMLEKRKWDLEKAMGREEQAEREAAEDAELQDKVFLYCNPSKLSFVVLEYH